MAVGAAAIVTGITDALGKAFDATAQIWVKKFDVDIEKIKLQALEETDRTTITLAKIKILDEQIQKQKLIVKEATKQQAIRQITSTVFLCAALFFVSYVAVNALKSDRPLVVKERKSKPEIKADTNKEDTKKVAD